MTSRLFSRCAVAFLIVSLSSLQRWRRPRISFGCRLGGTGIVAGLLPDSAASS